jgi:hypothetical protein
MIHIVMDIFKIAISMIKHILYVIIIMLIYGIKMIWKMPIFLTGFVWFVISNFFSMISSSIYLTILNLLILYLTY